MSHHYEEDNKKYEPQYKQNNINAIKLGQSGFPAYFPPVGKLSYNDLKDKTPVTVPVGCALVEKDMATGGILSILALSHSRKIIDEILDNCYSNDIRYEIIQTIMANDPVEYRLSQAALSASIALSKLNERDMQALNLFNVETILVGARVEIAKKATGS